MSPHLLIDRHCLDAVALADVVQMLHGGQDKVVGPLHVVHTGHHVLFTYGILQSKIPTVGMVWYGITLRVILGRYVGRYRTYGYTYGTYQLFK